MPSAGRELVLKGGREGNGVGNWGWDENWGWGWGQGWPHPHQHTYWSSPRWGHSNIPLPKPESGWGAHHPCRATPKAQGRGIWGPHYHLPTTSPCPVLGHPSLSTREAAEKQRDEPWGGSDAAAPAEQQWGGERGAEQGAERGSSPPSPAVTQAGIHRPEGSSGVTALGCLGPALCAAQTPLFYCLAVCPDGGGASSAGNLSGRSLLLGQKLQGGCSRLPVSVTPPCTSPAAGAEPPSHAAWVLFGGGRGWEGLLGKTPALPDATQRLLCAHLRLPKGIAAPVGGLREAECSACPMRGQGSPRY